MLRSLYSGISGLRAQQTALDVVSNNIANVDTTAFKASSVNFADALSQTLRSASGPQSAIASTNPNQVGLGVRVQSISTNLAEGTENTTGNNLDVMIDGDGYLVTKASATTSFTRNGALHLDALGRLAAADGGFVQGWSAAADGTISTGANPSNIVISKTDTAPATRTTTATLTGNLPSDAASGTQLVRNITVYGADGGEKTLAATFTSSGSGNWGYSIGDGTGNPATGTITSAGGALTVRPTTTNTTDQIDLDLTRMTGYAGTTTVEISGQNGLAAGTLQAVSIGSDGVISGSYSNGSIRSLAQLAMATFTNPEGLSKAGNSNWAPTVDSGAARYGTAGSSGFGAITGGALEGSNVDLSQEFSKLIVAQRAFQANARVITTSDEVLQELAQLKR